MSFAVGADFGYSEEKLYSKKFSCFLEKIKDVVAGMWLVLNKHAGKTGIIL